MKRKLNLFLRQRHLKITDVVLIVILGLMMSIQVIRWSGREIRQSQAAIPQSEQVKLNFIQKVAPIAESEQQQSHVLASITIAQAALNRIGVRANFLKSIIIFLESREPERTAR